MEAIIINQPSTHILRSILGASITRAFLLVWPSTEGLLDTDTQLNLQLMLKTGHTLGITFRTGIDEQTPVIEEETISKMLPYSSIHQRALAWKNSIFDQNGVCHIEAFDITSEAEFHYVGKSTIQEIFLICYAISQAPLGIKIVLSSGHVLWSVSSGDGNRVFTELPDPWFHEEVILVPIV
jgi:hypothetical protein